MCVGGVAQVNDENQYTDANGVRYVAKDAADVCKGCAFDIPFSGCATAGNCMASARTDQRSIIWVAVK